MKRVIISLETNDAHGNDTGKVSAIQLDDAIDLQWGEIGTERGYRIVAGRYLFLQRQRYEITGTQTWYGNWCWTGVVMDATEAVKLLNNLSKEDRWHCEGGWCDLTDAFAEGKVTQELLEDLEIA